MQPNPKASYSLTLRVKLSSRAGVDAFPICLNTKDPDEIVRTVKAISTAFGGINLEDISAPRRCCAPRS